MSDIAEKTYEGSDSDALSHPETIYERPKGWRGLYYHPVTQVSSQYSTSCGSCSQPFRHRCLDSCALCVLVRNSRGSFDELDSSQAAPIGLFNAVNGLGAGGQVDSATSANANAALYSTFAFFAFFAGYALTRFYPPYRPLNHSRSSINNRLGSRLTLLIGSTGYGLYIGSYL